MHRGSDRAARLWCRRGRVSQLLVRNRIRELRADPQKLEVLRQEINERRKGADTHNLHDNIRAVSVSPKEYAEARERQVRPHAARLLVCVVNMSSRHCKTALPQHS